MILTTQELINLWKSFKWTRYPKEVHIHHTWKPTHSNFNENNHLQLHESMKNHHIKTNGWSDIGQHLTLFPDGKWVVGRDWNINPASILGRNSLGFAIEMVGNFDIKGTGEYNSLGYDKLEGKQLNSILQFLNFVNLPIIFHREYSDKTCPGTSIDKNKFIQMVKEYGSMIVNIFGKDIKLENVINQDDLNYVQLRELFDKMNCKVEWKDGKTTITLK